jgi:outer membrane protein W
MTRLLIAARREVGRCVALSFVLVSVPAAAQQLELTPLVGYATSAAIDQTAVGVQDLAVDGGVTWGGQGTYFLTEHVGVEGLWMYQSTGVRISTTSGSTELFHMTANQLHGRAVYQFRDVSAAVRPFVSGGLGATLFGADDLERETKVSWDVGGGVKWFVQRHVGLRLEARYKSTELHDASSTFCGPFGFCQDRLQHIDIGGGAVFRF